MNQIEITLHRGKFFLTKIWKKFYTAGKNCPACCGFGGFFEEKMATLIENKY